ncbi:MAG: metal-sensing transcriptional repressor [Eubacteriales bacterium]|nr:metal-sensing transcriptional repressor [Eubacteriales bacterium]
MKNCTNCENCKHKQRDENQKKLLLNRLRRLEGQLRGLQNMVENDRYCVDILIQTQAAKKALDSFMRLMLSDHIKTCVAQGIREGNDEVIEELTTTLYKLY